MWHGMTFIYLSIIFIRRYATFSNLWQLYVNLSKKRINLETNKKQSNYLAIVHGRRLRKVKSQKQGIRLLIFYRLSEDLFTAVWSNPSHNVKAPRVSFFQKHHSLKVKNNGKMFFLKNVLFFLRSDQFLMLCKQLHGTYQNFSEKSRKIKAKINDNKFIFTMLMQSLKS